MAKKDTDNLVLREHGLKVTAPRQAVLSALSTAKKPETVQELHSRLSKKGIDLVTVYRTLALFEKEGIIRRIDLRQDSAYYELNTHHHHHIVCLKCGLIEDFELCDIDTLTKKIASRAQKFKTVSEHNLELYGMCTNCTHA